MQKNDFEKALNLAYFYLKFRPRTRREVELYLQRRALKYRFSPEVVPDVLKQLTEERYLDDRKFVEMYIHDRLLFKPRSVLLLTKELEKLGVDRELVNAYFELHEVNNAATAGDLLRKKWVLLSHLPEKKRFMKAINFLKAKGFSYGDSLAAYRALEGRDKNPFEE